VGQAGWILGLGDASPALAIGLLVVGFALIGWSVEERSLPQLVRVRLQREPTPEAGREEL
jgi:hypothetical protein